MYVIVAVSVSVRMDEVRHEIMRVRTNRGF